MRKINKIVIHCSDSCDSLDIGRREIDEWHKARGWSGIGYHFLVRRNGTIEIGRPEETIGAHVKGHNRNSIGICWIGKHIITAAQKTALYKLLCELRAKYSIDIEGVVGHYELASESGKTCPNLDMSKIRADILFKDTIYEKEKQLGIANSYLPKEIEEVEIDAILEQIEKGLEE